MKSTLFFVCFASLIVSTVQAQSWLPKSGLKPVGYRLLECSYEDAILKESRIAGSDASGWEVRTETEALPGTDRTLYTFTFKAKRHLLNTGVAVAFDCYDWSSDNYVMIPASVYNGNRQRIVNRPYATGLDSSDYYRKELALTSNPIPQLSPEFGARSRLDVNISNTATPAITYLERLKKRATLLLTDQGIIRGKTIADHALIVEEAPDRSVASFVISAPGVREKKPEFIGFSPSPDRGVEVFPGEEIVIRITRIGFDCPDAPALLARFHQERKTHTGSGKIRNLIPLSHIFGLMVRNIDNRYYKNERWEYYCPENADWMSFGWIGGLMNTYPMLVLGDAEHLRRVRNTFDFSIPRGQGKSGYFINTLGSDGKEVLRDAGPLHPETALVLKNGDLLYWMIKQFLLLKDQGREGDISPVWENSVKRLADAFVSTWDKEKTWGNYINVETGDVAVYNTTSGALVVGGLVLAADYYQNPHYMEVALEAVDMYYRNFVVQGFTAGGCGDILQNSDSQVSPFLMLSLMTLYEATGEKEWIEKAQALADLCATWTVSFPYRLPEDTPLAKLGASLTGAVWASTQNKHGAPGFCTISGDPLFKIYRATGDTLYAELMRDIMHAHAEGIQPNGQITERLTYCDADSRGSRGDGGKTGWNELNGALMALEIPGIYVRTDKASLYVFDHVDAKIIRQNNKQLVLQITNSTPFDATVTVLAENADEASRPLAVNAFMHWNKKVKVKAGGVVEYKLNR